MTADAPGPDREPVVAAEGTKPATPWLTVAEAAARSRHHPKTVYALLRQYEATGGRKGLRGYRPMGRWIVDVADVDAWIKGEKYGRRRTLRSAS